MVALLVQVVIIGLWSAMLVIHTRRLLRLARVETLAQWGERNLKPKLNRVWWWLGREEYWRAVQVDGMRCMQLTFMMFLMVWGVFS
jgi:hypothetical protein